MYFFFEFEWLLCKILLTQHLTLNFLQSIHAGCDVQSTMFKTLKGIVI